MSIYRLKIELFKKLPRYIVILYAIAFISSISFAIFALSKQLTFGFDQARDAYEAYSIWHNHDFKILGPSSDLPGVHHGVLWYYLLALPYAIGSGNPEVVAAIFFVLSFLTIPLSAYLSYKLFHNFHVALLTAVLYASSPLFQAFTRWLSNPLIALYVVPFLLFFLWKYIDKQKTVNKRSILSENKYVIGLIGLFFGIFIQADFAFGLFLIILPIYWFVYKISFKLQEFIFFWIGFLFGIFTYVLAEVRFSGKAVLGMIDFFSSSLSSPRSPVDTILLVVERVNDLLSISILPFPYAILLFVVLVIMFLLKKSKNTNNKNSIVFLVIWLSTFIVFYLFKSGFLHSGFMFVPFLLPITIIGSYLLINTITSLKFLVALLTLVFLAQFYTSYLWFKTEYNPLSVQYGISLSLEKEIIRYTYEQSKGERFIIVTITNPLHINTTWAYLYETYGQKKYSYLPYYGGRAQRGYLGNLSERQFGTKYRYVIVEPTTGIPDYFIQQIISEENTVSDIIEEKKFGQFVVQKRIFRENKSQISIQ
ncbi:MAG: hypothetical protein HYT07_02130 [Candidatus Levybacteria bacterium]|nr:hypothetical protein [Candidatus Levybacteria bacterium]